MAEEGSDTFTSQVPREGKHDWTSNKLYLWTMSRIHINEQLARNILAPSAEKVTGGDSSEEQQMFEVTANVTGPLLMNPSFSKNGKKMRRRYCPALESENYMQPQPILPDNFFLVFGIPRISVRHEIPDKVSELYRSMENLLDTTEEEAYSVKSRPEPKGTDDKREDDLESNTKIDEHIEELFGFVDEEPNLENKIQPSAGDKKSQYQRHSQLYSKPGSRDREESERQSSPPPRPKWHDVENKRQRASALAQTASGSSPPGMRRGEPAGPTNIQSSRRPISREMPLNYRIAKDPKVAAELKMSFKKRAERDSVNEFKTPGSERPLPAIPDEAPEGREHISEPVEPPYATRHTELQEVQMRRDTSRTNDLRPDYPPPPPPLAHHVDNVDPYSRHIGGIPPSSADHFNPYARQIGPGPPPEAPYGGFIAPHRGSGYYRSVIT